MRSFGHRNDSAAGATEDAHCRRLALSPQQRGEIYRVAVSADGSHIATAGWDCSLRVWETGNGKEIRRIDGLFSRIAMSANGRWVAARFQETGYPVRVWEVATGREIAQIRDVDASILLFDDADRLLMSGRLGELASRPIIVWDAAQRREVRRHTILNRRPAPEWSFDGQTLVMLEFDTVQILDSRFAKPAGQAWEINSSSFKLDVANLPGRLRDLVLVPGKCCVAVAGDSGEIALLDRLSGILLAKLVSVRDDGDWLQAMQRTGRAWSGDDWLVVTPDGLFDGPPGAFNKLLWRFSDQLEDVAPAEAFFNEFYRPGLLADILEGRRPAAPRNIAAIDRRQPRIEITAPKGVAAQSTVNLKIRVSEAPPDGVRTDGSGVRDVRLFRNGSLVHVWRGDALAGNKPRELDVNVRVTAGENRFSAYAFNRDNVKSADAVASVEGSGTLKRGGTAWVLAVGVNRYANSAFDLLYSVPDAETFAAELQRAQGAIGNYERVQTVTLRDGEATKANILAALRRLAGQADGALPASLAQFGPARPEDAVFIFFAGHGLADDPRFYLVPHDIHYTGNPGAMGDAGFKAVLAGSISDLELEQALENVDAGRVVMVIDACHSGQVLEAEEKRRGPMNSRGLAQLAYEKGMYVLTASQGHQAALEFEAVGHGLLTHALVIDGLKSGAADRSPRDGRILIREWLDHASNTVPRLQLRLMQEARSRGRTIAVVDGDQKIPDELKRTLQQPRVFYRREAERDPFVIGPGRSAQ